MPLSRIYRHSEPQGLKAIRFLDFDEQDGAGDGGGGVGVFVEESMAAGAAVIDAPRPHGAAVQPPGASEEALAAAYRKGREEALAGAAAGLVAAADALGQALTEIGRLREGLLKNSTGDMVRLVTVIAEQVIQAEIATRPEFVLETLKRALKHALKADEYHVRVHPDDLAVVTENKPLFLASISGLKSIRFEDDPAVAPGGCLVESRLGQVDATIDSQLEEIRQSLRVHLEGA